MKSYKGIIFIFLTALCFSTQEIVGKYLATDKLNSLQINLMSFLVAAIIFLPFALNDMRKLKFKVTKRTIGLIAFLGIVQVSIAMTLFQEALVFTTPAIAAVILCSNAIITIPVARVILKEKMPKFSFIAIILAAIGIIVILNPFAGSDGRGAESHMIGVGLCVLGAIAMAFYNVFASKATKKVGPNITNSFSFFFGVAALFIFMIIFRIPILANLDLHTIGLLVYLGIVVKGIGYFFFLMAIKETSAITATSVFYIKPIIVPILMFIIMGKMITINVLIGTLIIIVASIILYKIKKNSELKKINI